MGEKHASLAFIQLFSVHAPYPLLFLLANHKFDIYYIIYILHIFLTILKNVCIIICRFLFHFVVYDLIYVLEHTACLLAVLLFEPIFAQLIRFHLSFFFLF